MLKPVKLIMTILCLVLAPAAFANMPEITVPMNFTAPSQEGHAAGAIQIIETNYGLVFIPNLQGLTPGLYGFHIHQNPSCDKQGAAAGSHFDPKKTNKHLGPYDDTGHLGDLPAIYVNGDGTATLPVLAPRLKTLESVKDHSLIMHSGGDNYSDAPVKLGGAGNKMVCGIIKG